ncbi:unnamed protein product [Dicrocoelium dendriticum]|nr:unnamed protein product [Dicrocoelium dendriticum]
MARPDSRYAAPECLALTTSWAKSLISRHCRPTPEGREVEYEGPDEHPVPKITKSKAKTRVDGVYTNLKSESPGTWSDMFSLGLLICSMYTTGQPSSNSCFRVTYEHEASLPTGLHDSVQQTTSERGVLTEDHSEMLSKDKNAEIRHAKQLADDETLPSAFRTAVTRMPLELVDPVEKMLSRETHRRPTSQLFSLLKFFNDPALICLDVMLNFENKTQEDRLKGLQSIVTNLDTLPKEIIYEKLVPLLLECYEKLKSAEPTPAVSDSNSSSLDVLRKIIGVFAAIVEYSTPRNYEKYMEVPLVKLLESSRDIYSKTEILRQVSHLTKHASAQVIEQLMVPIVCSCLESQITDTKIVAIESLKEMSSYFQQTELDTLVLKRLINSYGRWSDQFRLNFTIITSLRPMVRQLSIRAIQEQLIPFLVECCKSVSADAITVNGSGLTDVVEQPAPLICSVWKDIISTRANSLDSQVITRQIFPSILPHILNQTLSVTEFRIIMSTLYALLDTLDVPTAGSQTSMDNAQYYLIPAVTVNTPNDTCTSRRASGISIGQRDSDQCEINSGTRRKTVRAAVPFVPMLHPKQLQEMEQSPNLPRRASAHVILPLPQSFDSAESITGRASDRSVPSKSIFNLSSPLNLPLPSFSGQRRHSSDAPRERTSQQVPILHIQSNQHSLSRVSSENTMSNLQHSLAVSKRQSRMLESPEINLLTARVCEGPFISAPSIGMSSRRSSSTRIAETVNDLNMIRQNVANQSRPQLTGGLGDVPSARKSSLYALGDAVFINEETTKELLKRRTDIKANTL